MPEVDPRKKKNLQNLIDRMEKGFDENMLGPLVDSIVNEPEKPLPSESKVKPKKIKFQVIKVSPTGQGESLADFLGGKLGESFSMAAQARRADKGLKKDPGFYLFKAAKFQFGGDLINRTKGTFSQNPTDVQDPALSPSRRFSAAVNPYFNEQGPQEPPGTGRNKSDIARSFEILRGKFDDLINLQKNKSEQAKVAQEIQQETSDATTKEIKESNDIKKKSVEIQKKFIAFNRDQAAEAEVASIEAPAEETKDLYNTEAIDNRRDDEDEDGGDDREGGNPFTNFLDFGLDLLDGGLEFGRGARVGRRGASRIVKRTALRLGGKRLAKSAVTRGAQAVVTRAATALSGKAVIGFLRPIFKRIPIVGGLIDFVVSLAMGEPVGRAAAKAIGATLGAALGSLIPIPGVGTIAGGIVGDLVGGAIYDAVTGGAPPEPTGATEEEAEAAGAPTSYADQSGGLGSPDPEPVPEESPEKLASGGFLAGEAGSEYKFDLSSTTGKKVVKNLAGVAHGSLAAAPFIIGITDKVLENLGPAGGQVRAYIKQIIGPIEKLYGSANFNIGGKSSDSGAKPSDKDADKLALNMGTDGGDGSGNNNSNVESQETMTGGPVTPVNVPGSVKERAKVALQFYLSKGFSDSGAAYMVGNLMQESMLDPAANGDNGKAWGLAQWREDAASGARWIKYKEWAAANNKQVGDFYAQLEYTIVEGNQYNSGLAMMKGNDIEEHKKFIKAYEGYSEEGNRFGYGQDILNNIAEYKGAVQNTPPSTVPSTAPASNNESTGAENGPVNPLSADQINAAITALGGDPSAPVVTPTITGTPGPDPASMAPVPNNLPVSVNMLKKRGWKIQPILVQGSSTPVGYQTSNSSMGMTRVFDKTGSLTTLDELKQSRLQTN